VLTFKSKEGQQNTGKNVRDIKNYLSNGGCLIVMIKVKTDSSEEDIDATDNKYEGVYFMVPSDLRRFEEAVTRCNIKETTEFQPAPFSQRGP